MSTVSKSIDVEIPVSAAFEEWTRFEDLPRFMRGVVAVKELGDRHLHWRGQIAGVETIWELELIELAQDQRIAWSSRYGPKNSGSIVFDPLSKATTRVTMEVHYDPATFVQSVTDYLGVLDRWVASSLARFKVVMTEPYASLSPLPHADELVGQ